MDIIGLTVCVNYSDILQHGLKTNAKLLKHWYIITSSEDKETSSLIEYINLPNVSILVYDHFFTDAHFNKGGALRFGQQYVKKHHINENYAVLILDADITILGNISEKLPKILDKDTIYGVSIRSDYHTVSDYNNLWNGRFYVCSAHVVGFFQLYSRDSEFLYPESADCGGCDNFFKELFEKTDNLDIEVKHLGRECVNWYGRKYEHGVYRTEGDLLSLAKIQAEKRS